MTRINQLASNLELINKQISSKHLLVIVTKYQSIEDVELIYQLGYRHFGESKVQDLVERSQFFLEKGLSDIKWHFIGQLQSNKIQKLMTIKNLHSIHSVDSLKKCLEILRRFPPSRSVNPIELYLQMNISHEEQKGGLQTFEELAVVIDCLLAAEKKTGCGVKLVGLMGMSSSLFDEGTREYLDSAHKAFRNMYELKDQCLKRFPLLTLKTSLGMSGDYQIALQYGADVLRLGSVIFK